MSINKPWKDKTNPTSRTCQQLFSHAIKKTLTYFQNSTIKATPNIYKHQKSVPNVAEATQLLEMQLKTEEQCVRGRDHFLKDDGKRSNKFIVSMLNGNGSLKQSCACSCATVRPSAVAFILTRSLTMIFKQLRR